MCSLLFGLLLTFTHFPVGFTHKQRERVCVASKCELESIKCECSLRAVRWAAVGVRGRV